MTVSCLVFSSRRRHTRCLSDWSSDVCSSDLSLLRRERGHVLLKKGRSCGRQSPGGVHLEGRSPPGECPRTGFKSGSSEIQEIRSHHDCIEIRRRRSGAVCTTGAVDCVGKLPTRITWIGVDAEATRQEIRSGCGTPRCAYVRESPGEPLLRKRIAAAATDSAVSKRGTRRGEKEVGQYRRAAKPGCHQEGEVVLPRRSDRRASAVAQNRELDGSGGLGRLGESARHGRGGC